MGQARTVGMTERFGQRTEDAQDATDAEHLVAVSQQRAQGTAWHQLHDQGTEFAILDEVEDPFDVGVAQPRQHLGLAPDLVPHLGEAGQGWMQHLDGCFQPLDGAMAPPVHGGARAHAQDFV